MKVKLFIKNTVILVLTSLLLRTAGIVFRIYLADKIGEEGIGLYQLIFSVYLLAAAFATSGISTAVTRLVADNIDNGRGAVRAVMRKAVTVTLIAAAVSTSVIFFAAKPIAIYLLLDKRAIPALKILSFSLGFMGISSCARGYFIACRKTVQPSVVQLLEQAVRIAVVMAALSIQSGKGIAAAAAAVLFGDTVAEGVSFAANYILYVKDCRKIKPGGSAEGVVRKIIRIALPITGGTYVSTALHTSENLLVPTRLAIFHGTRERGLELFGAIRGMAMPVLFFPASFLTSLATLLIPEVSEARSKGRNSEVKRTVSESVKITLTLSVFISGVFMLNADDVGNFLYGSSDVGGIIRSLSPIIPFMYLESVATGILKGLDEQLSMFRYNCFDSVCRIVSVIFLLPVLGIKGYLLIMTVSNCFTSSLCCRRLIKSSGIRFDIWEWVAKPLICTAVATLAAMAVTAEIESMIFRLVLAVAVQALVFALMAKVMGVSLVTLKAKRLDRA